MKGQKKGEAEDQRPPQRIVGKEMAGEEEQPGNIEEKGNRYPEQDPQRRRTCAANGRNRIDQWNSGCQHDSG